MDNRAQYYLNELTTAKQEIKRLSQCIRQAADLCQDESVKALLMAGLDFGAKEPRTTPRFMNQQIGLKKNDYDC